MKLFSVFFGLLLANGAVVAAQADTNDAAPGAALVGSCTFEGQYASGCIEFLDGSWDGQSMHAYCKGKSKEGTSVKVVRHGCERDAFDSLCANVKDDGSVANMYVNRMPSFICRRYVSGTLYKRPAGGW